jgi:hypothetical protein
MKPTAKQDILLKEYLRKVLRYRETYEEVYDHILTALAHNPYTGTLEEAVNQILREDFGGYDQLQKMESKAKSAALKDGVNKYLLYFFSYFKWPALPFTLGFAVLVYFTLAQVRLLPIAWEALFALIILTPAILSLRRYYWVGYVFRDKKRSVRDDIFARISMVPTRLIVFLGIGITINISKGRDIWQHATPMVLTALYVLSAVYLLSLIKLYKHEFKMTVTL